MKTFLNQATGLLNDESGRSIGPQAAREERERLRDQYKEILDQAGNKLTSTEKKNLDRIGNEIDGLTRHIDAHQRMLNQAAADMSGGLIPGQAGQAGQVAAQLGDSPFCTIQANGRRMPLLRNSQRLAAFHPQAQFESGEEWSLTNFVKASMGIERPQGAVTTGPSTVPLFIGSQIVDDIRAASRVIAAGAGTIAIDGPTNLARITGDPTCYQHAEGASDIETSDMTLAPVVLNPKMIVCQIPLTVEVVQDSQNLQSALQMSVASAIAGKLDSLCLATILASTAVPDSAAGQSCATWAGTLQAVASAISANQDLPNALISNPGDWMLRNAQTDDTGAWMGKAPALEAMQDLFTSKMTAGTAIFGDWFRAFAIAVRQDISFEVIRWQGIANATHLLVAYCRMDGVILQPKRLYIQKTTVA